MSARTQRRPMRFPITVRWSAKEGALVYGGSGPTARLAAYVFESIKAHNASFAEELDERGYDLKTLRLTVWPKSEARLLPHGAWERIGEAVLAAVEAKP